MSKVTRSELAKRIGVSVEELDKMLADGSAKAFHVPDVVSHALSFSELSRSRFLVKCLLESESFVEALAKAIRKEDGKVKVVDNLSKYGL